MNRARNWIVGITLGAILLGLGTLIVRKIVEADDTVRADAAPIAAPVEVAPIVVGPIEARRVFSGSLEATARTTIAPKIAGRILSLPIEIADEIRRGQVVAQLDSEEYEQAMAQVRAELAVASAGLVEAENAARIARRELDRVETLHERGVASESQLDTVRADHLSKESAVEVAKAQVTRAEAMLETARIRLGYTTIRADWEGDDDLRVVAERIAEEGDTVSANTPLASIIELDPIKAVIFTTERDYALLAPGQPVTIATDAHPERRWSGQVARIAPVFLQGSRQARVEIRVPNEDGGLKPGMFVRVEAILGREEDATIVPVEALAERADRTVVFIVDPDEMVVRLVPVRTGVRDGDRVQVFGDGVRGSVVTLGQQLIDDGSPVSIPERFSRAAAEDAPEESEEADGG